MTFSKASLPTAALLAFLHLLTLTLAGPAKYHETQAEPRGILPNLFCHHKTSTCIHYTITKTKTDKITETKSFTATATVTTTAKTTCKATTVTITETKTKTSTASAPPGPTFDCPKEGYNLPQNSQALEAIDISTGQVTTIASQIGDGSGVNAIGYNIVDNTFYAIATANDTIVHIFRDGSTQAIETSVSYYNMGDCDLSGHYWLSYIGTMWLKYDVDPSSSTYGTLLDSGTSDPPSQNPNDWAFIPVGGPYFWSITASSADNSALIFKRNSETHVWSEFANYPDIIVPVWGAAWGEANGTLFAMDNTEGTIYNFPLTGKTQPFIVSQGPLTGSTDAARCINNLHP